MAYDDTTTSPDDTAALIQQMMAGLQPAIAAMGPTDADRQQAGYRALMMAGLGTLGARKNHALEQMGRAGLMGLQGYSQDLKDIGAQRTQSIGQAVQLSNLARQAKKDADFRRIFNQPDGAPVSNGVAPVPGVSPRTAAQFGPDMGDQGQAPGMPNLAPDVAGVAGNTTGFMPMPAAPLQVPAGTDPTAVNGYTPPSPMRLMPRELRAMIGASGDPKYAGDKIEKFSGVHQGPDGTVIDEVGNPRFRVTPEGIQYFSDGRPGVFVAYPKQATDAAVARAGALKRGELQAGAEFETVPYQNASGQSVPVRKDAYQAIMGSGLPPQVRDALVQMPADQAIAAAQRGARAKFNLGGSPGEQAGAAAAVARDLAGGGGAPMAPPAAGGGAPMPAPMPSGGNAASIYPGGGASPSPLAVKGAEARIEGDLAERKSLGDVYAKQSDTIDSNAANAATLKSQLAEMQGLAPQFQAGAAAPVRQRAAELAQALGADSGTVNRIAGGDVQAMQEFNKQSRQIAFNAARTAIGGVVRNYQEIEMMLQSNPSLGLLAGTNEHMMKFMDGTADYTLAKQQERDNWLTPKTEGGMGRTSLAGFEAYFNRTHPASKYLPDPVAWKAELDAAVKAGAPAAQQGGGVTITAPNGKAYQFPNQAAADAFKAKAGMR